ncbi:MAG TPA: AAA family ATPase [Verrucomicrobiae bacterium]|nr:AAA family ATPase [Verrucomicrobiae bacterium]
MRKWMRDRIQRRKKKTAEPETKSALPPLQPAYFEAEQAATSESPEAEASQPERHVEPVTEPESAEPAAQEESPSPRAPATGKPSSKRDVQRGRRRRRGGRGRGGRGREAAVAQAFAPASGKGTIPEIAEGVAAPAVESAPPEGPATEVAEPEPAAQPEEPAIPRPVAVAPTRPPKGIVVLAIGLPGSGKSTWFKRHNLTPLSSDMMRALLFDDVREQRFQDLVFSNLRAMLKARLIAKRPMNYVDATNLTPQERQHWIKLAKDYNYEVHAVFFDVPLEVCIERHQRRDRVVPEDAMRRMAAKLKPPSFEEGFAKITVVRVKKKAED